MTTDTASMTIEPGIGGRFYETATDGTEAIRGIVLEWAPPSRVAMTWRVGPRWRSLTDDEHAPHVEVDVNESDPEATEVTVTYTHLERCDPAFADQLVAVLAAPGPGDTLERYARVAEPPGDCPAQSRPASRGSRDSSGPVDDGSCLNRR